MVYSEMQGEPFHFVVEFWKLRSDQVAPPSEFPKNPVFPGTGFVERQSKALHFPF